MKSGQSMANQLTVDDSSSKVKMHIFKFKGSVWGAVRKLYYSKSVVWTWTHTKKEIYKRKYNETDTASKATTKFTALK